MRSRHAIQLHVLLLSMLSTIWLITPLIAAENVEKPLHATGASIRTDKEGDTRVAKLSGGATVTQGDISLAAETITVRGAENTNQVIASRPFTYTMPDATVAAEKVTMDTLYHIAHFSSSVQMQITRQTRESNTKQEILFSADTLSLDYEKRQAQFTGHVTLVVGNKRVAFEGVVLYDLTNGRLECEKMTTSPV